MFKMKRWAAVVAFALALAAPAFAQSSATKTLSSTTCPGSGCVTIATSNQGGVGVVALVPSSFSGQFDFQVSMDGQNWKAWNLLPGTSSTGVDHGSAAGAWNGGVGGMAFFRVIVTSYSSGSVTIQLQSAPTSARSSGGGGGGTPGGPDTSVQFNNGGSFGGSASLTWDGTTLLGNSFVTAATDTGATFQSNATKLLLKTATGGPYALAMQNESIDPAHYGSSWYVDNEGTTWWSAGTDQELLLAPTPSTSADPTWANSWQVKGDLLDYSGSTYSLGRASNPWAAVYANNHWAGGIAEPDLSCCDGPTSNGFTSIANGYIQNNYVAAGDGLGYTNLTFYASQGTVASPTTQIAGAGIWGFDYYAYGASSYEYRGSLYAQTDALDATHTESQWAAFGTASGSASVKLNSRTGMVTAGGDLTVTGLTGAGNLPACIDSTGKLYKGSNTAGVLSCP